MKIKSFSFCLITALLTLVACRQEEPSEMSTAWCVLIDMSGVRENPETRQHYANMFTEICEHISAGDELNVAFITESSANEMQMPVSMRFEEFETDVTNAQMLKEKKRKFNKEFHAKRDSVTNVVNDIILNSSRVSPNTEIMSALYVAGDKFRKSDCKVKQLLILSDMEEYSKHYKFPVENFTEKRIANIITSEKNKPQGLPQLNGVMVHVAGAQSKTSDRFFAIRNFWMNYFEAAGAEMKEENYGAAFTGI